MVTLSAVLRLVRDVVGAARSAAPSTSAPTRTSTSTRTPPATRTARPGPARPSSPSPATGAQQLFEYAPRADGRPDPGEVVWAWVPYEDDPSQGKDRPVLVVGRDGDQLLALALTSKDHDRDAADERRHGRVWMDVGTGGWDARGRPSEVRLDRLLHLDAAAVRREGAALDRATYRRVADAARAHPGDDR